ncbi:hypothetical protein C1645_781149 [Glomus cerebriforme]|uniref:Uncharacterized protein n=1 Tax=Glomus cerebriforme TaxID=658196 RepID=A0A397SLP1_9GLOM|nr:hypothetical protein C1645_781149 [Glomus cerebriforme]
MQKTFFFTSKRLTENKLKSQNIFKQLTLPNNPFYSPNNILSEIGLFKSISTIPSIIDEPQHS